MATAKGSLPIGGSVNNSLQTLGEQDLYTVALVAGYNYQFNLAAAAAFTNPGNLIETLSDPNNVTIATSNSQITAGSESSKSISITPTVSGTYTLSIAATNGTGNYTLTSTPQDDVGPTPGQLAIGNITAGTLESLGDTDTFTVPLAAGFNYQFSLAATSGFINAGNLVETLIAPNGTVIPTSNSQITAGSETSKSISITPTTAGTYTLSIAATNGTGNYTLTTSPQDDIGPTPGQLAIGSSKAGVLENVGDTDTFTVTLAAGYNYQFVLAAASAFVNPGNLVETLIGPTGSVIPTSNSQITAGSETSKSISITPTTAGTYTLSVAATNGTGNYLLTATPQDDFGPTPGTLTVGGNNTGALQSIGDTDTFTVALTAGLSYKISLAAATGFVNPGNLVETLYGPNNVLIPNSNSQITAGSESSKSISITPATTGTYTLSIAAINGTGTYTINVGSVPTPPSPVYRFFDNTNGTHFFTSDPTEKNNIIGNLSSRYTEETNGFCDVSAADPNATAVYRFFDTVYGTHFFTASASERDTIQATRPDLTYEPNSTFYEHATQQSGDVAVYRFFDSQYGTHFYTGDASEYAGLTTPGSSTYRTNLTNEGVGFYAPAGTFR